MHEEFQNDFGQRILTEMHLYCNNLFGKTIIVLRNSQYCPGVKQPFRIKTLLALAVSGKQIRTAMYSPPLLVLFLSLLQELEAVENMHIKNIKSYIPNFKKFIIPQLLLVRT